MAQPIRETQERWVQSLGQEDPLEEEMATHSTTLAWEIPDRGAWWAIVHRITKESEATEHTGIEVGEYVTVEYVTLSKIACSILKF